MNLFPIFAALATDQVRRAVRRNLRAAAIYGLAIVAGFGAIGYALAAAHFLIAERTNSLDADLILCGVLLAVAIVLLAVAYSIRRRREPAPALSNAASLGAPLIIGALGRRVSPTMVVLGAAVLAGVLLARAATRE